MKSVALIVAAWVALSACQTTKLDDAVSKSLPKACAALDTAYVAFTAAAVADAVGERTVGKVEAAYAGVAIVCEDRASATATDALVRVIAASAVVAAALKQAS